MAEHRFSLKGSWTGGRNGEGKISAGAVSSDVSAPKDLAGPGKGTNPEELLLSSVSTCYLITLAAVLERRKLEYKSLDLDSELYVVTEPGLKVTKIVHRPKLRLAPGATLEQLETAKAATDRAEKACIISAAMRGNVEVHVEPEVSAG